METVAEGMLCCPVCIITLVVQQAGQASIDMMKFTA
jgi:uncharacterized protein YbaR (Trm112 family)